MERSGAELPGLGRAEVALRFLRDVADPREAAARMRARFGPVSQMPVPGTRLVFFHDAELLHPLFHQHHDKLEKDDVTLKLRRVLGDGLLTAPDAQWRPHRRLVAPSFVPRQLRAYANQMVESAVHLCDRLEEGVQDDLQGELLHTTIEVVSTCLFGAQAAASTGAIRAALSAALDRFTLETRTWRRLLPERLLALSDSSNRAHVNTLDTLLRGFIAAHQAAPEGQEDLLIARLLAARADNGVGLTDEELRDEALTLFAAGAETTALALTYTLWLLAEHPTHRAAVEGELASVLGGRNPTPDDLQHLPVLDSVLSESLRLFPPAWAIGRTVLEDLTVGPWQLHAEDTIFVVIWSLHRDPLQFPDPERFAPERWRDGLAKRLPRYAYMPFGAGPRTCVGNHFALMELRLVLAVLLQTWRFSRTTEAPLDLEASVTLRPRGPVSLHLERR